MASILASHDPASMRTVVNVPAHAVGRDGMAASDAIAALALAARLRIARRSPNRSATALIKLLGERPESPSIPAVLLTAWSLAKGQSEVCNADATAWVGKLYGPNALIGLIGGMVGVAS